MGYGDADDGEAKPRVDRRDAAFRFGVDDPDMIQPPPGVATLPSSHHHHSVHVVRNPCSLNCSRI
jgi:hypothetical protein